VSTASFYELAGRSAKSAEVRALMADLLTQAQERDRLQEEFTRQVAANRTRREGKPPKLSKAAMEWIRESEADAQKAAAEQAERIARLSDAALLRLAFSGWDTAVLLFNPASYHEDDQHFAKRIDRHNKAALRLVKSYFRAHALPIPASSTGGIAFIAAFRKAVPDLGTLGNDYMAIEPALAALDKLAKAEKLTPLSDFVNPDTEGLSGEKAQWFDPAAGLATVRGLLDKVCRSARAVKNAKQVAEDLRSLESDLALAERAGVKFHFVMLD
jgi:hypothetical protein